MVPPSNVLDGFDPGEVIALTAKLISIPSPLWHETDVARWIAAWLEERGFAVDEVVVPTAALDSILDDHHVVDVHFMSVDVEGAESVVLQGLSLERHRPWVLCVEAVLPGTTTPSHDEWEPRILTRGYRYVTFDGVNRWYVADEHADLADQVAVPFNAIDAGADGWVLADHAHDRDRADPR